MKVAPELGKFEKNYGTEGSGIIVNRDSSSLEAYKRQKESNKRLVNLENEVAGIKNDLKVILNILETNPRTVY